MALVRIHVVSQCGLKLKTTIWANGAWVLGGDFNIMRFSGERDGPVIHLRSMQSFNDTIRYLALSDPPIMSRRFTWTNDRNPPTSAKLDKFLLSQEWENLYPLTSVTTLRRPISDHVPILLNTNSDFAKPKIFKFEKMWLQHVGIDSMIASFWAGRQIIKSDSGQTLHGKTQGLKTTSQSLGQKLFWECYNTEKGDASEITRGERD